MLSPTDIFAFVHCVSPHRHTHCGCDQVFSRHSTYLRHEDAKTLPHLNTAIVASWESKQGMGRVVGFEVTMAADVKAWLGPCLDPRLKGHTTAHQFVFEKKVHHGEETVVMTAKLHSVSEEKDWKTVGALMVVRHWIVVTGAHVVSILDE